MLRNVAAQFKVEGMTLDEFLQDKPWSEAKKNKYRRHIEAQLNKTDFEVKKRFNIFLKKGETYTTSDIHRILKG